MCIQYKPTVVACFCILLACKWSNWEIPLSNEKKEWYTYVDPTVTAELLQQLTSEFLVIFENCPSRLKEKIMAKQESSGSPFEADKKLAAGSSERTLEYKGDDPHKHRSRPHEASASGHRSQEQREREYKERKEKERIAHMSGMTMTHQSSSSHSSSSHSSSSHHHRPERPSVDPKMKLHSRPPSSNQPYPPNVKTEPRDILREAAKDSPFGIPTIRDPNREHVSKDPYAARSDNKEVPKRDMLLKPNVQTDPNSLTNYSDMRQQQRIDPSRSRIDPSKSTSKQDMIRRYEEQKPHIKSETDNIKKHLSSSFDKNSAYLKSSTSQKIKSPFSLENKSVPKTSSSQAGAPPKSQFNGNTNGSYNKPHHQETEVKVKTEPVPIKEEIPTPAFIKRPSLFSPEKTPPQVKVEKTESSANISSLSNLTALSPINSPPSVPSARNRNYSSSSEPELRPTMKKIDQVEGFENLMRDSTIGMANIPNVTDTVPVTTESTSPIKTESKSGHISPAKDTSQNPIVNGLETNPTLISNLLKEAASTSHLPGVATNSIKTEFVETVSQSNPVPPPEHKEKEHHHHKSKKKKEKHKHRDKDKNREEKDRKKKHKDKDREKHKHKERKEVVEEPKPFISEPIKIKIQRDKIQPLNEGLKIKIPKDKIKTEGIVDPLPQPSSGGLKIKIPKEMIANCSTASVHNMNSLDTPLSSSSSSSRKRERDRSSPTDIPPLKFSKSSHKDSKQNGRHSCSKVSKNQPSSSENVVKNSAQVISSNLSENTVNIVTSEEKPSTEIILASSGVPVEENNNESIVKDVKESTTSCKKPSSPKDVSSTVEMVSPTPLSPISPFPASPFHETDSQLNSLSMIPLSPISASNTPPLDHSTNSTDIGYSSNTTSFDHENLFSSNQLPLDNISGLPSSSFQKENRLVKEFRSNTPPGYPTTISQPRTDSPPRYKSPPPYYLTNSNLKWQPRGNTPPGYPIAQATNSNMEGRKPPPYNPYKLVNHPSPYKRVNTPHFQKQHRNSGNYENYDYSPYNPPPYQSKSHRGYNPPPKYPPHGPTNYQAPPPQTLNAYHVPPPQNQDSQLHYSTAPLQIPYNAYQVAPPSMPNVNVPPPSYVYPSYIGGYMYQEMYPQQMGAFGGVSQPPLPPDAPPNDVPPPPPPE